MLAFAVLGCALFGSIQNTSPTESKAQIERLSIPRNGGPVAARVRALAQNIEVSLTAGDTRTLDDAVDWTALANRILNGMEVSNSERQKLRPNMVRGMRMSGVARGLISTLGETGEAHLVRVKPSTEGTTEGSLEWRALLRLVGDGSLSYVELYLESNKRGKVAVVDAMQFITGELISDSMRSMVAMALSDQDPEYRRSSGEIAYVLRCVVNARNALVAGNPMEARSQIESVPKAFRKDRAVMMASIDVYANFSQELHLAAIQNFQRQFPGDPAVGMKLFEAKMMLGDFDGALAALDEFDKQIGGDAYLDIERAQILIHVGRNDEAYTALARFHAAEPEWEDGLWMAFELALKTEDAQRILKLLPQVDELLQGDLSWLEQFPTWQKFLTTDAGRRWSRSR